MSFGSLVNFEAGVLELVYSAHDDHTYHYGRASNVFSFGSPFQISSVSEDESQPLEVYMAGKVSLLLNKVAQMGRTLEKTVCMGSYVMTVIRLL